MTQSPPIRIPNLPFAQIVDSDGYPTDDELTFRQGLVTSLQNYIGNEGLVMPSQSHDNIITIQNHQDSGGSYTCLPGTQIYNTTDDSVMISILVAGVPVFKTVTLS